MTTERNASIDWHSVFEYHAVPTMLLNHQHQVVAANRACAEMFGLTLKQVEGKHCYELLGVAKPVPGQCAFSCEHRRPFEVTYDKKSYLMVCSPVTDSDGNITNYIHSATDITVQKEQEEKFRALTDHSFDFICELDSQGRYSFVNQKYLELGYEPTELVETDPMVLMHPDDCELVKTVVSETFANQQSTELVYRAKNRDGVYMWFESTLNTYVNSNGELRMIAVSRDITDRKLAEDALKEKNRELEELRSILYGAIENSSAGIIIADAPDVTIRLANSAALGIRGESDKPLTNIPIEQHAVNWQMFYPDGTPYRPEDLPLSKAIQSGEETANTELIIRRQDGEDRLVIGNATPVRDTEGNVTAGIIVFLDITEQRKMEEQLRQSQKMDSIGQLAGGIAHDFNNQLAGIMGFAEILAKRINDTDLLPYLDKIIQTTQRAADLTNQLLAFARKGQYQSVGVDIHQTLADVTSILRHTIDKRIRVELRLDAATSQVMGDPSQLQNAILNLGLNARDAMPSGGELVLETTNLQLDDTFCHEHPFDISPGNYFKLAIRDSGTGINKAIIPFIFEPFFTTKEPGKGTGMGLAAVYGTIKSHRGAITVDSELGKGACFSIYLPLVEQEESEDEPTNIRQTDPHSLSILLIDDEEIIREIGTELLVDLGYQVVTCKNGLDGVAYYKHAWQTVDLVILDLVMPEKSGRETFSELLKINPAVKVLLSSGYSLDGEAQVILDQGAKGFIQKPFLQEQLMKVLTEIIEQSG